jgi:hypothetical protein
MTMTIADGATLEKAVPWVVTATPAGDDQIANVVFLVDGKQLWTETNPPYSFDDDGQVLPPWLLGAGTHVLSAHATTTQGASADLTAHVTVVADLSKNRLVAGTYRRTVTAADQRRSAPYRTPDRGAFGDVSPTGMWTLMINAAGDIVGVGPDGDLTGAFDEPYTLAGHVMRLYGPAVWHQKDPSKPSLFCDPEKPGDYTWSLKGASLTLKNLDRVCADRDTVFVGTWKRV